MTWRNGDSRHFLGIALARKGEARDCQGTAIAGRSANRADGTVVARGTHVYDLAPDGRTARVVGLWNA